MQQLSFKSPYELLYNQLPTYSYLRVFGCLCYIADVISVPNKFNPRGLKCLFLGYPFGKKGYRVMHLDTKKCYTSRDVSFVENVFPFHTHTETSDSLFPNQYPITLDSDIDIDTPVCVSFPLQNTSTPVTENLQ